MTMNFNNRGEKSPLSLSRHKRKQKHTLCRKDIDEMTKVIAVDFDGTLFENEYPAIGRPILKTINYCIDQQRKGAIIILWTCRKGKYLRQAVEECKRFGLFFDKVNKSDSGRFRLYGYSRKIYADEYIDDHNKEI